MKKLLPIFLVVFCSFLLSGCGPKKTNTNDLPNAVPTPVPTKPIEESIKERPFVSIVPTADGHWVEFSIKNIKRGTTGIEYELTYFAEVEGNKIERGVSTGGKPVNLGSNTEYTNKVLFGSASCTTGTCKYKYDENVTEGTLTIKLVGSLLESYSSVFRIQKGSEGTEGLTTGDGVFAYISSSLSKKTLYLTTSSIGVPKSLPSDVTAKSVPYATFPNPNTKGTVSFKTSETEAIIMLWDGSSWTKLATTITGGIATAETSKTGTFILVK